MSMLFTFSVKKVIRERTSKTACGKGCVKTKKRFVCRVLRLKKL